eukprot:758768-Hanusia_phi.AAC.6
MSSTDQEHEALELSVICTSEICKHLCEIVSHAFVWFSHSFASQAHRFLEKQREEKKLQSEREQLYEDFGYAPPPSLPQLVVQAYSHSQGD